MVLASFFLTLLLAAPRPSPWIGAWSFDLCHEDRKPEHECPDTSDSADGSCSSSLKTQKLLTDARRFEDKSTLRCPKTKPGEQPSGTSRRSASQRTSAADHRVRANRFRAGEEESDQDRDAYCREGCDTIQVAAQRGGGYDITLCPSDPWGEKDVDIDATGTRLSFRTPDGLDVRLVMSEDLAHYKGRFRTSDGHSGRIWGRRVGNCADRSAR